MELETGFSDCRGLGLVVRLVDAEEMLDIRLQDERAWMMPDIRC